MSPISVWYVMDDSPTSTRDRAGRSLQRERPAPANLDQVLERAKDIQYSSKTRFNTKRVQELENLRQALTRLMEKLPPDLHDDADYKLLQSELGQKRQSHRPPDQPAVCHLGIRKTAPSPHTVGDACQAAQTTDRTANAALDSRLEPVARAQVRRCRRGA